jgi:AcrR family transcriptional regulator
VWLTRDAQKGVAVPRPRQALLTRELIVAAATELLDAEGLAAVSTRRLAQRLGVRAPSLYNHFATKDEILEAVADAVSASVDLTPLGTQEWPVALSRWAHAYRAAIAAHPNVFPLLTTGPGLRPAALRAADAVYGALVQAGWPASYATRIGAAMRYLVIGSALGFAGGFVPDPAVYAVDYPHLHDAHRLAGLRERVDSGAFDLALAALIDGLVTLYPQVAERSGRAGRGGRRTGARAPAGSAAAGDRPPDRQGGGGESRPPG